MDKIQRQILLNQKEIMLALIRNLQAETIHELIKAHNKTRDLLWEDSEKRFEEINENANRTNKEY